MDVGCTQKVNRSFSTELCFFVFSCQPARSRMAVFCLRFCFNDFCPTIISVYLPH